MIRQCPNHKGDFREGERTLHGMKPQFLEPLLGNRPGPWTPGTWLLMLLVLSGAPAMVPAKTSITVGASLWPPYADPKLPGQGLALSIVTAALERGGYHPNLVFEPWHRTLEQARAGRIGVIATAWRTAERERDFLFSDAYLTNRIVFLKRRGTPLRFQRLRDLKGLRVGVVYGYAYDPDFDQATDFAKAPETHLVPNLVELLAGHIDLVVGDERTLRYELARHFAGQRHALEFLPKPLAEHGLHLAVSRRHPRAEGIVAAFNRGLAEIRREGTYRELLRQANEEIWKRSYLRD